jgi:hypothetical protein
MDELMGLNVKVTLNSMSGFITYSGKFIKSIEQYILLETTIGPIYLCNAAIKTIQVIGEHHEEK